MPKDFKNINRGKNGAPGRLHLTAAFMTGLLAGLLVALLVYVREHHSGILTAQKPDIIIEDKNKNRPLPADIVAQGAEKSAEQSRAPQPQFDFYQILPNMEVNVSEWEEKKEGAGEAPAESNGIYILQTGSFEQYESADEMKARLALLGVKADIQRVVINGRDIRYRVRVGPYQEQDQLEETRKLLLANNMDFVLLRLNVSGR